MAQFRTCLREQIRKGCDEICQKVDRLWFVPSPLLDRIMDETKYLNYGVHGVGMSTGADSLTAIEEHIFNKKDITVEQLLRAVDNDFAEDPELLHLLRYETPKLGCDSDEADDNLCWLMDAFADALQGRKNEFGGVWRAGSGSAMFYLWHTEDIGASADGRRKGEPLGANYAVSLFARPDGPFSVIRSMTKPELRRVINGGPLTVEFHDSMFADADATFKVGQFVKRFIHMGGHQLQLNAVNAQVLKDAQAHPEKYPQLIVRIWGWSAYFVELDRPYQDHVIARQEYSL
jgi:formate C-acetyltransferase